MRVLVLLCASPGEGVLMERLFIDAFGRVSLDRSRGGGITDHVRGAAALRLEGVVWRVKSGSVEGHVIPVL